MHILGYGRVSRLDLHRLGSEAELDIAANQQRRRLERAGCTEIFFDVQSGADDDRPNFEQLMSRVRRRYKCDRVVITRDDRITRSTETTFRVLEIFEQTKCELVILEEGDRPVDLSNPYEWKRRMSAGIDAEYEIKMSSLRIRRGFEDLRQRGRANHKMPFGYLRTKEGKYAPHPDEFAIAQEIPRLFCELRQSHVVCCEIYKKFGLDWSRDRLRRWLKNEVLRGNTPRLLAHNKPKYVDYGTHPDLAIITPEQDRVIQAVFQEFQQHWGRNANANRYPLGSGLCKCARCGHSLSIRNRAGAKGQRLSYFWCHWHLEHKRKGELCSFNHSCPYGVVEAKVIAVLTKASEAIAQIAATPLQPTESPEIRELRQQLKQLERIGGRNPAILSAKEQVHQQIIHLEGQQSIQRHATEYSAEVLKSLGAAASDPEYWENLPDDDKRRIWQVLIKAIDINGSKRPGSRFVDYQIEVRLGFRISSET